MSSDATPNQGAWRFAVDRGGTFTDVVATTPDGALVTHKLLSENPGHYDDAATEAVHRLMKEHGEGTIAELRIGTTVATNALLERKGERLALVTTRGFGDALRIGTQARPEIFARHIILPEQLPATVIEIDERVSADGDVLQPLDEDAARSALEALRAEGFEALAIILMHGWKYRAHEARLAEIARDLGFAQVSVSHEVAPLIKYVPRGDTTVVDAYLSPVLKRYTDGLQKGLPPVERLRFMQSNGGLAEVGAFRGKDAILSGPAGGVVGMVAAGEPLGHRKLIGFDMGGTSTDVAHYAGELELAAENLVAGVRVAAPMMQIHTVAAGGGSICSFDGARFRVGPESGGADPGPACYRKGGPLTVTDCNLVLGRIDPAFFPHVFGPDGDQPLDPEASKARLEEIASALPEPKPLDEIARGFLAIAVDNMANAIRKISVARGHDVTEYALACFGGAGGQHACKVADELGIETVLVHPLAGILSAYGIGLAPVKAIREVSLVRPLHDDFADDLATLEADARADLTAQGVAEDAIELTPRARLRFEGSDSMLTVACTDPHAMDAAFRVQHRQRYGYSDSEAAIIVEALSVEASGTSGGLEHATIEPVPADGTPSGDWPTHERAALTSGQAVTGPALIIDPGSTTVVDEGWEATLAREGSLVLTRAVPLERERAAGTEVDPVKLEIFNNLFMAIAEEMGVVLQNTATSVNIKERLDFSCALFNHQGELIANAPHIPVHLGSMGESVARVLEVRGLDENGEPRDGRGIRRGDAYVLNDPFRGGTHLPDITVIAPVFYSDDGDTPDAFVAARGHHADIGGIAPGSMPPESRTIEEEGVLIDALLMVDEGTFREDAVREALADAKHPARRPDRNLSDLRAQLAACTRGAELLHQAAGDRGAEMVSAYMDHVLSNAEESVRALLGRLEDGSFAYPMDNGAQVKVAIRIDDANRSAVFDFTGTSDQQDNNFNAPRSITRAAALYVLRTLIDDPIPMNDGCLRPVELVVPEGSMLNPQPGAAVVAGNVETSQVVTDCLFAATGRLAPSQGTMNNFTFGNENHQYYETIAGGSGAGPDHDGTSAVQTHMTNSRLTDPEILETRLPVRLDRFAIRRGSGGKGAHVGGDGVERRMTFLEDMRANMLANRRAVPPRGIRGGGDALPGRNWVERGDGTRENLSATESADMRPGDAFVILTPGGGGFGDPPQNGEGDQPQAGGGAPSK
ncbi:hydantoinase B/oxoprolinase family protein [Alteriqipengyuania lutimaris]|uniref:5-oxoprolinase n=1 Tax=Alteriqipengyuania lutimaris TaxID=1538146 RepID=A0A395LKJ4_9SPHN|nr:hydantoinase B/oxoprolinase family protein [Alteriqipengyuania lutimaris]MBB3033818.1 5-oxoprolinase (ATP-hydrolyzing) [Alteriqipengyuania lutimaris]RDS77209.1 5-oxoprolinase [Alteriqipengyuania lutimaris]